jgi:hypothetical protein
MEAYKMKCNNCGRTRNWVGYKTGLGKTPEQLKEMEREETTCQYCDSKNVQSNLDRESETGRGFDEMNGFAAAAIFSTIARRSNNMLDLLHSVELALPILLRDETRWKSVFVNYHPPFVERLWCEWQENRIYLHCIHPCYAEDALLHPHPWPSTMKVLSGNYEMGIGHGSGTSKPPLAARLILAAGSEYEMTNPDGWHYVRPLNVPSISLMVTGKPWGRTSPKSDKPLLELSPERQKEIFKFFRSIYK